MNEKDKAMTIQLNGMIDFHNAQDVVTRIQAALKNGIRQIELHLTPTTIISSAEFIGFLSATKQYLSEQNGKIMIHGATGPNRSLLEISRLSELVVSE